MKGFVLVPLARFRVDYQVAYGRPYSNVERLVTRAISEGAGSLPELERIFFLPKRLLVEVLVTLARSGWISIRTSKKGGVELTEAGRQAVEKGDDSPLHFVEDRQELVFMERLTGAVAPKEMRYINRFDLSKMSFEQPPLELAPLVFRRSIDATQVKDMLRKEEGQWIKRVSQPELCSRDDVFLLISRSTPLTSIPERWRSLLPVKIKELGIALNMSDTAVVTRVMTVDAERRRTVRREELNLLESRKSHLEAMRRAFTEAKSTIAVCSAFIAKECISEMEEELLSALGDC